MFIRYFENNEWTYYSDAVLRKTKSGSPVYVVPQQDSSPLFFAPDQVCVDTGFSDFFGAGIFTGDYLENMVTGISFVIFKNEKDEIGYINGNLEFIEAEDNFLENSVIMGNFRGDISIMRDFKTILNLYKRKHYKELSVYVSVYKPGNYSNYGNFAYSFQIVNKSDEEEMPATYRGSGLNGNKMTAELTALTVALDKINPEELLNITVFVENEIIADNINKGMLSYWHSVQWKKRDGNQVRFATQYEKLRQAMDGKNVVAEVFSKNSVELKKETINAKRFFETTFNGGRTI